MLNKGESLIETILAISLFITLLIPTTNFFSNSIKISHKIDIKIYNKENSQNILELIKTLKQEELDDKICNSLEFDNATNLLKYLDLNRHLSDDYGKYILSIRRNNMYSGINNEYHGFYIKINEVEDIYVPKK